MMQQRVIHDKAEAAYYILKQDSDNSFMNAYQRMRIDKVLAVLKEIMEGTR